MKLQRRAFVSERNFQLRAECDDLTVFDHKILRNHFCNPEVPQALCSAINRNPCSLFPGLLTCADQFDNLLNAVTHRVLLWVCNATPARHCTDEKSARLWRTLSAIIAVETARCSG